MENDDSVSGSSGRRTRFQLAPDWSVKESLILVNEVAMVEAEWSRSLSSYQQWEIIAENCAAVGIRRNLWQCRRKWDALLSQYDAVRNTFGDDHKVDFDLELFKAIDRVIKSREERGVVDPESDPETGNEARDATVGIESKKRRQRSKSEKSNTQRPRKCPPVESSKKFSEKQDQRGCPEQRPEESHDEESEDESEDEYLKDFLAQKARLKCNAETPPKHIEMPLKSLPKADPHENQHIERSKQPSVGKIAVSKEENEEIMTLKLQELAEEIQEINAESAASMAAGSQNAGDNRTEFIRRQGDKLIASLGNFSNTLKQLCDLLQECK